MEKTTRSKKNKILSFLPKTATVSFQNHPFSPGREKRTENLNKFKACQKGFSGPIISMIPVEARIKSNSGKTFDAQEPTSPKISCMGQIKHKKKSKIVAPNPITPPIREEKKPKTSNKPKRSASSLRNIFGGGSKQGRKSDASAEKPTGTDRAPSLSQMKRFSSGRDALVDFDWKYYSEREDSDDEEDEDDVIIPHSAPILIGSGGLVGLEPRKEINLWKRRTMDPPKPLQLNGKGRPLVKLN
ncbi:hypothetical protein AQUCO_03500096v1 [Aquilegia coerulea]|uniref:Syringolide-induced protein 14-1-1 n=1 Tax=Aquilegia coerulea TaxID=218851 RepID=A0A2G5CW36_AQUCA|nr:hypothetical protein AQUCO_03500096v1 [Aquilegia coerulea]